MWARPLCVAITRSLYKAYRNDWSIDEVMALADELIVDPYLETKSVGIELVAQFHRAFTPKLLTRWKRWLAANHSTNWATTDAICGMLIGPLLLQYPDLRERLRPWSKHSNMWVRRASMVGLIPSLRRGMALDIAYDNARLLHVDESDLDSKSSGMDPSRSR